MSLAPGERRGQSVNWRHELEARIRDRANPISRTEYWRWHMFRGEPVNRKVLIDRYRAAKRMGRLPLKMALTPAEKIAACAARPYRGTVGLGGSCRPERPEAAAKRQAAKKRRAWLPTAWRRRTKNWAPSTKPGFTPPQARGGGPGFLSRIPWLGK